MMRPRPHVPAALIVVVLLASLLTQVGVCCGHVSGPEHCGWQLTRTQPRHVGLVVKIRPMGGVGAGVCVGDVEELELGNADAAEEKASTGPPPQVSTRATADDVDVDGDDDDDDAHLASAGVLSPSSASDGGGSAATNVATGEEAVSCGCSLAMSESDLSSIATVTYTHK